MNKDATKKYLSICEDGYKPFSLEMHDKKFHPNGYKEGDACSVREKMKSGDNSDKDPFRAQKTENNEVNNSRNLGKEQKNPNKYYEMHKSEIDKAVDRYLQLKKHMDALLDIDFDAPYNLHLLSGDLSNIAEQNCLSLWQTINSVIGPDVKHKSLKHETAKIWLNHILTHPELNDDNAVYDFSEKHNIESL